MSQEMLERALAQRAEGVHGAPLSFDDVRGRAVSIRRRRRAAVTGAVAAAVAVVAVAPALLGGGDRPGSDAPQPAPAPEAPAVPAAVLHDGTLTLPDGSTVSIDLDNSEVQQLGVLTDGRVVVTTNQPGAVRVYAADGSLQEEYPALSNAITMSADDSMVAWVGGADEGDRGVRLLLSGVREPDVFPGIPAAGEYTGSVDGIVDPTRILVNGDQFTDRVLRPGEVEVLETSEPLRVTDVSPDGELWAVQYPDDEADPQYGCAGLYDPEAATMVARSCETADLRFSPDGEHLRGAYFENNMAAGPVLVLDLALETVGEIEPAAPTVVSRAAWEDGSHLLVAQADLETNEWSLVRFDIGDGTEETVAGPVAGGNPELVAEYQLSE